MEPERCDNSAIPFFWKGRSAAARTWPSVDVRGTSTSIGGRFGFAASTALDKADLTYRSSLSNPKQPIRVLGLTGTPGMPCISGREASDTRAIRIWVRAEGRQQDQNIPVS